MGDESGGEKTRPLSLYTKLNILSLSQHLKIIWGPEVALRPQVLATHITLRNRLSNNYIANTTFFS